MSTSSSRRPSSIAARNARSGYHQRNARPVAPGEPSAAESNRRPRAVPDLPHEATEDRRWDERVAREVRHQEVIEASFDRADAYAPLGDVEHALEWLDRAAAVSGGLPPAYRGSVQTGLGPPPFDPGRQAAIGKAASPRRENARRADDGTGSGVSVARHDSDSARMPSACARCEVRSRPGKRGLGGDGDAQRDAGVDRRRGTGGAGRVADALASRRPVDAGQQVSGHARAPQGGRDHAAHAPSCCGCGGPRTRCAGGASRASSASAWCGPPRSSGEELGRTETVEPDDRAPEPQSPVTGLRCPQNITESALRDRRRDPRHRRSALRLRDDRLRAGRRRRDRDDRRPRRAARRAPCAPST